MQRDFRVNEKEVVGATRFIKQMRLWAVNNSVDPWAIRQALIWALEMDTAAALMKGIPPEELDNFDLVAKANIQAWIQEKRRRT